MPVSKCNAVSVIWHRLHTFEEGPAGLCLMFRHTLTNGFSNCWAQGLAAKAEQLLVTTFELQELQQEHKSLQSNLQEVQEQLESTSQSLTEAQ